MATWVCATCGPVPAGTIRHLDHDSPHGHETHECGSSAGLDWTRGEPIMSDEVTKLRAERDEAVKRRNEIQDEWARRMTLLVRLCSGNHGALTDSTLIPVAEVKRAILDAFGTDGQRALDAPTPADEIRAETLRWAADRIDPGPTENWPTPRSETWETALAAHRGTAARLRLWANTTTAAPQDDDEPFDCAPECRCKATATAS